MGEAGKLITAVAVLGGSAAIYYFSSPDRLRVTEGHGILSAVWEYVSGLWIFKQRL